MDIVQGGMYFVSDDFFKKVNDPFLKINYETTKRPHYLAFKESSKDSLIWMVPASTRVDKFNNIIQKKIAQGKPHDGISIVKVFDRPTVLLFQDMFPTIEKYIDSPYIMRGELVAIRDPKVIQSLEKQATKVVHLLRRGVKFTPTPPNVANIEKIMNMERQHEREAMGATPPASREASHGGPGATPLTLKEKMTLAQDKAAQYNKNPLAGPRKDKDKER